MSQTELDTLCDCDWMCYLGEELTVAVHSNVTFGTHYFDVTFTCPSHLALPTTRTDTVN